MDMNDHQSISCRSDYVQSHASLSTAARLSRCALSTSSNPASTAQSILMIATTCCNLSVLRLYQLLAAILNFPSRTTGTTISLLNHHHKQCGLEIAQHPAPTASVGCRRRSADAFPNAMVWQAIFALERSRISWLGAFGSET